METGKAIYKLLKDSSAVGAICADCIYPELAQQDADAPFVVYTVVDTTPSDTKTSTSKIDTARVELYCVGDDYETIMNLGIAVRGALDRQSGTISGVQVQSINFDASDIQFDSDQRVYVLEQTYNTRVQRTGSATTLTTFPGNSWTIEEVDGAPTGAVNKLIVSNGSLTIDGNTATLDTGGTSSGVSSVNSLTGTVELYGTNLNVQSGVGQTIYGKFQSIDGDLTSILQILKGSAQNELGVFSDVSDNTKPSLKVTTTNAILRGGTATLIKAEQTSPGTLTFAVAAGASDTETTGMLVAGQANGNVVTTFPLEVRFTGSTSGIDYGDLDNTPTTITAGQASAITANTAKTGITSGQASAITANTAKTGITSEQADAITANTAKTGITSEQASAIAANTAKTGITSGQASAITANTAKVTFPGFGTSGGTALEGDTVLLQLGTTSSTALAGDTTTITSGQASAITANTAKTGITSGQASAITANTAKVTFPGFGTSAGTALEGDTTIPTATSQLSNDSGFITAANELDGQKVEFVTKTSGYSNGDHEGKVLKFGSATLTALDLYQYTSGGWGETDANASGKAEGLIALALGTSEATDGLLRQGVIQSTNFSAFTAGQTLYVSETQGDITNAIPTASGSVVRVVGYALGSNQIYFDPSDTFIELA